MFGVGLDVGNIATVEQLEKLNKKLDIIINLLQGKPINYKEPKPKKVKEKKVKPDKYKED